MLMVNMLLMPLRAAISRTMVVMLTTFTGLVTRFVLTAMIMVMVLLVMILTMIVELTAADYTCQ